MARPLRIEYPGAFYHIVQRGNEKKNIFLSERDRDKFFEYLNVAHLRYDIKVHAYCLMDNHYHLILQTNQPNLSKMMHYLNTSYSVYFNTKRKRSGHLFQGRYKAILVQADEYLHHLSRYIHLNPVRTKLVESPQDYSYSSYDYFISSKSSPQWLDTGFILSMFGDNIKKARALYKSFILDYIGQEIPIIRDNITAGCILASQEFVESIRDKFLQDREDKEIPAIKGLRTTLAPEKIRNQVENKIENKRLARKVSIYLIRKYTASKLWEIANFFGGITDAGVSQICFRLRRNREEDKGLDNTIKEIEKVLNVET